MTISYDVLDTLTSDVFCCLGRHTYTTLVHIVMSVPSSSSNNISDNNKLGGTSPSPIEGIEGVPGPSSLGPMHSVLPQDEESEDYGDEEDEDDEDSSDAESGVSQ